MNQKRKRNAQIGRAIITDTFRYLHTETTAATCKWRALTGSTLRLQPAKRNHAQQLVCLRVFVSVWPSLSLLIGAHTGQAAGSVNHNLQTSPQGVPFGMATHTHADTLVQADLRGLDWTEGSEHSGLPESMSLLDLHNYSTRLTLACYHGDTNCRLGFKLLPACRMFVNSQVNMMREWISFC